MNRRGTGGSPAAPPRRTSKSETSGWAAFWEFIEKATTRFGPAGGILVGMLGAVKLLASSATQDAVIKEIFFGSTTGTRYVQIFVAILVAFALFDGSLVIRYFRDEGKELKRVASEKTRLQEQVLGRVSHSTEVEET